MKFKNEDMFLETQRTGGISPPDLIVDIIRNKEQFQTYLLENELPRQKAGLNILQEKLLKTKNLLTSIYNYWYGCDDMSIIEKN